jgi:hypothetical protein
MELIEQHDDRIDREWVTGSGLAERPAQRVDMRRQLRQPPFRQIDGRNCRLQCSYNDGSDSKIAWPPSRT